WGANGQTLHKVWQAHTERIWSLRFSPDSRTLASGSWDGIVKLWDVVSGRLIWSSGHTGNVNSVAFAPDGSMVASGGGNNTILWDAEQGRQVQVISHSGLVLTIDWSPEGDLLAVGEADGQISLWDVSGPANCLHILKKHTQIISELAFSPD